MNTHRIGMLRIFSLALFFCTVSALTAQQSAKPQVPVTFRFMSWEQPVGGLYVTADGKKFSPIHVPANNWGRNIDLFLTSANNQTLRLYRQAQRDGETVYDIVAEAPLAEDCLDFQIAVLRQKGDTPYRMIVLPNDPNRFQAGTLRAFNFSAHPALVKINDTVVSLAPLEWRLIPVKPDRKYRLILASALQVSNDWINAGREILTLRPGHRGELTVFFTAGSVGGYVDALDPGNSARALTLTAAQYAPPSQETMVN